MAAPGSPVDFSHSAVNKAVLMKTVGSPLTVYPVVLGALGGLAFILFEPTLILSFIAVGTTIAGFGTWAFNYSLRRESFARRYLDDLHRTLEARTNQALENLEDDLDRFGSTQGVEQLQMLGKKMDNLTEVLKRRFKASELTYGRYLGTAEQVYLSAVDNLRDVAVALMSVSTIEPRKIDKRLNELEEIAEPSDEQAREIAALQQRRLLLDQQLSRVENLVAQNESAMTALDNTATALANVKTEEGSASMDAEAAMGELSILAKRAGKYAVAVQSRP